MGAWGDEPWDNDTAADWFIDMFSRTDLAGFIEETLRQEDPDYEKIRAAAYVLIVLGKPYIWPVERRERDLKLAIEAMQEAYDSGVAYNDEELTEAFEKEIAALRRLLQDAEGEDPDLDEE